jgi:hypothetical protein
MPRYSSQNLAAVDPEFVKANNISTGGSPKKSRYAYGKQNNVLIAAGNALLANGLCLRLLPCYEETARTSSGDRQFVSFREGKNDVAFGDWARLLTCAHWVGNPGVCFIIHDGNTEINLYDSPLHVLRKVAWDSTKENPHPTLGRVFSELLTNSFSQNSHIGTLKKPEKTLFISASIVQLDERGEVSLGAFCEDPKKNARIIGLKKSAYESLLSALSVKGPDDVHLSGDMLSLDAAKLLTILPESYVSGAPKVMAVGAEGPETFHCPKFAKSSDPNAQYVVGYPHSRSDKTHFALLHDTFQGRPITLEPYIDRLVGETKSWDEYLWVPTYEEQAEMLAPAFPKEVLDYAWRDYPQYLRALPKGTTTFAGGHASPEELEEKHVQPVQQARPAARQFAAAPKAPAQTPDPVTPWDPVTPELSETDSAAVDDMFAASDASASLPPPPPPAAAKKAVSSIAQERLAAARASQRGR